jgi:hypothetical protein
MQQRQKNPNMVTLYMPDGSIRFEPNTASAAKLKQLNPGAQVLEEVSEKSIREARNLPQLQEAGNKPGLLRKVAPTGLVLGGGGALGFGLANAANKGDVMNQKAAMEGYLAKQANPLWNSNKNEWAGGGVNPLNWAGRAAQPAMDQKVNTRIRQVGQANAGTAPAPWKIPPVSYAPPTYLPKARIGVLAAPPLPGAQAVKQVTPLPIVNKAMHVAGNLARKIPDSFISNSINNVAGNIPIAGPAIGAAVQAANTYRSTRPRIPMPKQYMDLMSREELGNE